MIIVSHANAILTPLVFSQRDSIPDTRIDAKTDTKTGAKTGAKTGVQQILEQAPGQVLRQSLGQGAAAAWNSNSMRSLAHNIDYKS